MIGIKRGKIDIDDPQASKAIAAQLTLMGSEALRLIAGTVNEHVRKRAPMRGTASARTQDTRPLKRKTMTTYPGELKIGSRQHGGIGIGEIKRGKRRGSWSLIMFAGYGGIVERGHVIALRGEAGIANGRRKGLSKRRRDRTRILTMRGKRVKGTYYVKDGLRDALPKVAGILEGLADKRDWRSLYAKAIGYQ
ncbi:MAG: hypothetical protein ABFD60_07020 [Bryobacteraceae bacterium]